MQNNDDDEEYVSAGEPIARLVLAQPLDERILHVEWEGGRVANIDMRPHLTHRVFKRVLADDEVFRGVEVDSWGWAVHWPAIEDAAVPSSALEAWADGKESEFD